jgi:hypothetical protein
MSTTAQRRAEANDLTLERLNSSDPVLVDVRPAGEVVPGMTADMVLTSGRPMPWSDYVGGQQQALIYGAIYEGLAKDEADAVAKFGAGKIKIGACHEHGCVGSVAGIYTASMPVFVVENRARGNRGFCNFYEGASRKRLNYGSYDETVRQALIFIQEVIAPVTGAAVKAAGGIPLKPIMSRAVHMGDELHSRNTAASVLFTRELTPHFLDLYAKLGNKVRQTLDFLQLNEYFFLRLGMAAAKAMADGAHSIEGSSVVTAMTINCRGFAIRVGGLDGQWFSGPHAVVEARLFDGFTKDDIEWIGGESHITETVGLGGFAQAAAFALQQYQGGSADAMIEANRKMYEITVGESSAFQIPYFGYRGTPTAIDIFRVLDSGITPVIDGGLAGKGGGQIGAGILRAPIECFKAAAEAYTARYGGH